MRISATLPILALLAPLAVAGDPNAFKNSVQCGKQFPRINQAIEIFCNNIQPNGKPSNQIVVPSPYASAGVRTTSVDGKRKFLVSISDACAKSRSPGSKAWVPENWCRSQFHETCVKGANGVGARVYGQNKCQLFKISLRRNDGKEMFVDANGRNFVPIGMPRIGKLKDVGKTKSKGNSDKHLGSNPPKVKGNSGKQLGSKPSKVRGNSGKRLGPRDDEGQEPSDVESL